MNAPELSSIVPILRVADGRASLPWYERLGFRFEWEHRFAPGYPLFLCVVCGPHRLFLSEHEGDAPRASLLYLWVGDVGRIAAEFGTALKDVAWALETELVDPDGNRFRVGQAKEQNSSPSAGA